MLSFASCFFCSFCFVMPQPAQPLPAVPRALRTSCLTPSSSCRPCTCLFYVRFTGLLCVCVCVLFVCFRHRRRGKAGEAYQRGGDRAAVLVCGGLPDPAQLRHGQHRIVSVGRIGPAEERSPMCTARTRARAWPSPLSFFASFASPWTKADSPCNSDRLPFFFPSFLRRFSGFDVFLLSSSVPVAPVV